jgi:proteasome beta subunit|tara:strand:+ start:1610 stop:2281 length:672 start_codon:yes stop_codon:yes gene_type:complete
VNILLFKESEIKNQVHGTTTVGLVCSDGIVLTTDTRASMGYYIASRTVNKIAVIDNHCAVTIAGGVADAQYAIDQLKYHAKIYKLEKNEGLPISSIARLTSNLFYSTLHQKFSLLYADILVGGIDHEGPQLYNIDMFGTLTKEEYYSTGSGSPVAYGILESEFKQSLTVDEAMPIAVKAVYGAILRNSGTGDGLNIVTIRENNLKEYSFEEKQKIIKELSGRQ